MKENKVNPIPNTPQRLRFFLNPAQPKPLENTESSQYTLFQLFSLWLKHQIDIWRNQPTTSTGINPTETSTHSNRSLVSWFQSFIRQFFEVNDKKDFESQANKLEKDMETFEGQFASDMASLSQQLHLLQQEIQALEQPATDEAIPPSNYFTRGGG
jgi:hypothetical protein